MAFELESMAADYGADAGGVDEAALLSGQTDINRLSRDVLVYELTRRSLDTSGNKTVRAARGRRTRAGGAHARRALLRPCARG